MTEEPGRDEIKQAAEQQFAQAYHLPEGMARHEALERAARAADACDHLPLAVSCRIALLRSAHDLNRYDLMLAPFAWCGAAERRDPTAFDEWETHNYDWAHKWIVTGLLADPRFSLEQIGSVLEQLATRYRQHGFSAQPVHGARTELADHVGDEAGYREHFARYLAAERGPLSDCEACVVEEQARHLIWQGRPAEAIAHAEHQLAEDTGCAGQPQGILTTLTPAFVEVGDLERAREAHVVAHRAIRDDLVTGYLDDHLVFCATSGNVERGVELLKRHLHRVHSSTNPAQAMRFSAGAALLLDRLDRPEEFAVPRDGRTEVLSADELREFLRAQALEIAARFDERNGSDAVSARIRRTLALADTEPVPLAVPTAADAQIDAPVESAVDEEVLSDPVELAERALKAFSGNDFLTGMRLLRSLPADLDALLPDVLAARVAARRALASKPGLDDEAALAAFRAAVARLEELGEPDLAVRYRSRGAGRWSELTGGLEAAVAEARECVALAATPRTLVLAKLVLAELVERSDDGLVPEALELVEQARELAEPDADLLVRVRCARAEHLASADRLEEAREIAEALLAEDPPPSVRFNALRLLGHLAVLREDGDAALEAADALVAASGSVRGPWTVEAHQRRVSLVEHLGRYADRMGALREAVAVTRELGSEQEVVWACFALAGGYLNVRRPIEAAEALEEALRILEAGDLPPSDSVPVLFRLGKVCTQLGETDAALRHLEAALAAAPEEELLQRAVTLDALGAARSQAGQEVEGAEAYEGAARLWTEIGDAYEAAASWMEAASTRPNDDVAESFHAVSHAEGLLEHVDDEEQVLMLRTRIAAIRGFLHAQEEDWAKALEHNGVAEELADQSGDEHRRLFMITRGARFLLAAEDPENAEAEARRAGALVTDRTPPPIIGDLAGALEEALRAQDKQVVGDALLRSLNARLNDE
ncbi:hypothetical protein [Actinosynnema mirum]|uniref:Tetratricopeptide TPR_2 repeat protein n=1 Tax=Actinosynnema mirum (strain ATCC 29888 / DSM 43827 / JCM 3225 / NBRC 14064 / NCIMB 13271 / NRRL B-12336 / IMRU 3971 / 101) TaxID=446462 RepID=C6WA96_ACTMD|nr:hypothetical protein [Actinosynnema mirum]ACU39285.1 Tetratricopeptide TPR_2 repeat protein [Actinosynnema mirum DSM 43827]